MEIKDLEGTLTINTENEYFKTKLFSSNNNTNAGTVLLCYRHDNCLEIIRKITEGDLVGVRGRPGKNVIFIGILVFDLLLFLNSKKKWKTVYGPADN